MPQASMVNKALHSLKNRLILQLKEVNLIVGLIGLNYGAKHINTMVFLTESEQLKLHQALNISHVVFTLYTW